MARIIVSVFSILVLTFFTFGAATAGEFSKAWLSKNSSIVLDAYEYTPLDWSKMSNNKRLAGFINKASDGLPAKSKCGRNVLCRVKWKRYVATYELYHTRRVLARTLGMKWGAYHLARPGNPIAQAEHFLQFTKPDKDDLLALDIEHNDPSRWMSLAEGEVFAKHIKMRTGRYPVLYTNHSTSKFIAAHRDKYPLLSRLNLWYARYKPSMKGAFPMGNWDSYTLWQFSSMVNCNNRSCPWRINGAGNWIDVNVVNMSPAELKRQWPFAKLRANRRPIVPAKLELVAASSKSQNSNTSSGTQTLMLANAPIVPTWRPGSKIVFNKPQSDESEQKPSLLAMAKFNQPALHVSVVAKNEAEEPIKVTKPARLAKLDQPTLHVKLVQAKVRPSAPMKPSVEFIAKRHKFSDSILAQLSTTSKELPIGWREQLDKFQVEEFVFKTSQLPNRNNIPGAI